MTFTQHTPVRHPRIAHTVACLGLLTATLFMIGNVFAAGIDNTDLNAQYQREKATCTSGQSNQDRATCLREAGAAYQQAKQGRLSNGATTSFNQNALQRCKALPAQDQADCQRRIENPTVIDGDAQSGGILRKDVTIVPAPVQ